MGEEVDHEHEPLTSVIGLNKQIADALSISERTAKAQRLLRILAGPLWVHFRDLYDDRGQLISHSRTQPGLLVTCK